MCLLSSISPWVQNAVLWCIQQDVVMHCQICVTVTSLTVMAEGILTVVPTFDLPKFFHIALLLYWQLCFAHPRLASSKSDSR